LADCKTDYTNRSYGLILQELFKGRHQVAKETGRKQKSKGDLTVTLFACSGFEAINN